MHRNILFIIEVNCAASTYIQSQKICRSRRMKVSPANLNLGKGKTMYLLWIMNRCVTCSAVVQLFIYRPHPQEL